jgi:uncharacterized phiE125 gp8 family phage protein
MKFKVSTAVVTEPISLATAKLHMRATSNALATDFTSSQSIKPGSQGIAANFGLVGSAVEVLGKSAMVNLNSGACGSGGNVAAKIQQGDDNVTWEDFTGGAFTTVTEANDNAVQEIEYTGGKRYVRVVATVAGAACNFSADVLTLDGDTTEDALISGLITAAREYCEGFTRRSMATQTIKAYADAFPCVDYIELPRPPLQSVTSVKYKDSAGTETTMTATTDYLVDTDSDVGRIVLPYGGTWPSATLYPMNPITVEYVAGYNASNPIPETLKLAMLLLIGHWYNNREAAGTATGEIAFAVKALLTPHKAGWF